MHYSNASWKYAQAFCGSRGFLNILWSSIKCIVDWQLSCPKTGKDIVIIMVSGKCVCVCFQAVGKREEILSFKANQAAVRPRALLLLPSRKAFALRSNF